MSAINQMFGHCKSGDLPLVSARVAPAGRLEPDGSPIGTKVISSISAGEYTIVKFLWHIPNPYNYPKDFSLKNNGTNDAWHFCLLAQIKSPTDPDPINTNTYVNMLDLLQKCNNFAMKNVAVVNFVPGIINSHDGRVYGSTIAVGNLWHDNRTFDLHFDAVNDYPITNEAEVIVSLNSQLWERWQNGGMQMENARIYNEENKQVIITDPHATLNNINFEPDSINRLNVQFNFVTEEVTGKKSYQYDVTQYHYEDDQRILDGGERYSINRYDRSLFNADGGPDKLIYKNDSVTLYASDILEAATYNWYDENDSLVYIGRNFTVSPEMSRMYKLEVVADIDGFKSYDSVLVNVKKYYIASMFPNPANNSFTMNYKTEGATSAYIIIMQQYGQTINSFILNLSQSYQNISIANLLPGMYQVVLVCDGQVFDAQTLTVY